jgi:outer membrane protein OmpA-like peptidoglycan-associated protein
MVDDKPSPLTKPDAGEPLSDEERVFQELRSLLLSSEQEQILALRERLLNPELRAQDVSAVVAEAIRLRREKRGDHALTDALGPPVEEVLRESVRKDPRALADALFPVMGPAIRRSITESLRSMLQSFNEALEHSLSMRGLKWRIEAIRTGRPFAEVVLLRSLIYRVEQVFLIHRKSGLLLQHVVAPAVAAQDPDMVSGMLSAIQEFVRDSFQASQGETLNTLQVGELQVWVEQGPQAILAAVIRGHAPEELHFTLKEKLEEAHRSLGQALEEFEGNAAPFEALRDDLEQCLEARFKTEGESKPRPYFLVLVILIIVLLAGWKTLAVIQNQKWDRFVENLRQQPGIVVTSFSREGGRYRIQGLRDPLATEPLALLAQSQLDPRLAEFQLKTYYSTDDALVLKRAEKILQPPPSVTLSIRNGILQVAGESPPGWAKTMRNRAPLIAGLSGIDESALDDADSLAHQKSLVESAIILFGVGSSAINADQQEKLGRVVSSIRKLASRAQAESASVVIEVVGHTDNTGAEAMNTQLSQRRANRVVGELLRAGINAKYLRARPAGSSEPLRPEDSEANRQFNRSVTFRVIATPAVTGH